MSTPNQPDEPREDDRPAAPDPGYGSLSIEDDPDGTVDPGELAGGASTEDEDVS